MCYTLNLSLLAHRRVCCVFFQYWIFLDKSCNNLSLTKSLFPNEIDISLSKMIPIQYAENNVIFQSALFDFFCFNSLGFFLTFSYRFAPKPERMSDKRRFHLSDDGQCKSPAHFVQNNAYKCGQNIIRHLFCILQFPNAIRWISSAKWWIMWQCRWENEKRYIHCARCYPIAICTFTSNCIVLPLSTFNAYKSNANWVKSINNSNQCTKSLVTNVFNFKLIFEWIPFVCFEFRWESAITWRLKVFFFSKVNCSFASQFLQGRKSRRFGKGQF